MEILRTSFSKATAIVGVVLVAGLGCVSGSVRKVKVSQELPSDLPIDLKEKFEIKEATFREVSNLAPVEKKKPEKKDKKTIKESGPKGKSVSAAPFAYPSRRDGKDPIWLSEKLVYSISYFGVSAGKLTLQTLPFKKIAKRKVYHIRANAISSSVFSLFYRLNDVIESFMDYDGYFSHRFHVVLDETKQTRDSLELNDSEKKQTYYWNRWHHKTNGYTETKEFSPIESFSQDSVSALYYVRTLPLPNGTVVTFPVVSEGKSWDAVCTVLRREKIDTPMGNIQAIVIRPEMKYQGILKKSGDSSLWLTDDDRRIPIRLEAKVRIGTVVGNLIEAELGSPVTRDPVSLPAVSE